MPSANAQETNGTLVECLGPQRTKGRCAMTKTRTLTTLAAAATLGLAAIAAPQPAEAYWRGGGGGAVAAGIIGGLAGGALVRAAARGPHLPVRPGAGLLLRWRPRLLRRLLLDPSAGVDKLGLAFTAGPSLPVTSSQIEKTEA